MIKGISLSVLKGNSLVFVGKSGSGKSTLLKICAGIYTPTKGKVYIAGLDLQKMRRKKKLELLSRSGFVFQKSGLISNINIFENIALSLRYHNQHTEKAIQNIVTEKLETYNLVKVKDQLPASISPGHKKLVSFIRGTIIQPEILFFDDPISDVDSAISNMFIKLINDYVDSGGTAITVTNNSDFCDSIATHIALIDDGMLVDFDKPERILKSDNEKIKQILINLGIYQGLSEEVIKLLLEEDII